MIPAENMTYMLAYTPTDYKVCHELLRKERGFDAPMTFPTVIARRDGNPIGFLSTHPSDKMVIAGKIVVKDTPRPIIIIMRLIEAYEFVLHRAGVTMYNVPVDKKQPKLVAAMRKIIGEPYAEDDENLWFKRIIQ